MNYCIQKYTTHQFTYYIYDLFQNHFKTAKNGEKPKSTSKDTRKTIFCIYLISFLLATHLN